MPDVMGVSRSILCTCGKAKLGSKKGVAADYRAHGRIYGEPMWE